MDLCSLYIHFICIFNWEVWKSLVKTFRLCHYFMLGKCDYLPGWLSIVLSCLPQWLRSSVKWRNEGGSEEIRRLDNLLWTKAIICVGWVVNFMASYSKHFYFSSGEVKSRETKLCYPSGRRREKIWWHGLSIGHCSCCHRSLYLIVICSGECHTIWNHL